MLQTNYLKMVMHINVIAQQRKLRNKKKELDKKNFPISIIENGEMYQNLMLPKI